MKVTPVTTSRSNIAKNQYIIRDNEGNVFFQSYSSVVAKVQGHGVLTLSAHWDYSDTTRRYLYDFLREYWRHDVDRKMIQTGLKSGEIQYVPEASVC